MIVGVAKVTVSGLFGLPTLYTTYYRAVQYIPNPRYTTSYVLVEPKSPSDVPKIKQEVTALGYLALTKDEFITKERLLLCLSDRGRDQHSDHDADQLHCRAVHFGPDLLHVHSGKLERFGALKAIGTKNKELVSMILFQASFTALTGYGLGVGLCTLIVYLAKLRLASYAAMITYPSLLVSLVMVVIIAGIRATWGCGGCCGLSRSTSSEDEMPQVAINAKRDRSISRPSWEARA